MLRFAPLLALLFTSSADRVPKQYTIDLDTSATTRWNEVCADYKSEMVSVTNTIYGMLSGSLTPTQIAEVTQLMDTASTWVPEPFNSEMQGISSCSGIEYPKVAMLNFFYDFVAQKGIACSGIVANAPENVIYHGRNLDFGGCGTLTHQLRNDTITVSFTQKGKEVVRSTTFAGLVGLWTGQKPYAFTVEGNERHADSIDDNISALKLHKLPPSFVIRQTLFSATKYSEAVKQLSEVDISAPVYFILGGTLTNEGIVLTRDIDPSTTDDWPIKSAYGWYLAQMNSDHGTAPGPRRAQAIKSMNQIGSPNALNTTNLWTVMSTPNILNCDTIFSCIMSASKPSLYHCMIRDYPN
eukprot:TRINITY_DN8873_c0_g2_i1.p1 TRINITY_DN8873_c0_g2~~TRINITY_DN8873_c0_g2_i1.p1  ORF type:complete len:375 (+),score=57.70 TRINITY_DN8873_c0_g2_i1:67-1125(+)